MDFILEIKILSAQSIIIFDKIDYFRISGREFLDLYSKKIVYIKSITDLISINLS